MKLAQLAPEIQEKLLFLPPTLEGPDRVFERHLRFLASVVDWEKQKELFRAFEVERGTARSLNSVYTAGHADQLLFLPPTVQATTGC